MVGITYGIQPYGGHTMGWTSPLVLASLLGGLALLGVFCLIESRVEEPMFHLGLFRIRAFAAGNLAALLAAMGRGGLQFILIIWLQGIWLPEHGYNFAQTPLWAGIYMLPLIAGFLVAGPPPGYLSDRFGARPFATGGMILAAASFLLLIVLPVDFSYIWFALILLLNGVGMGLFSSPNSAGVMNSLPASQRGAGAGMLATFMNSASVLSIGVFFTLMIVGLASGLPNALHERAGRPRRTRGRRRAHLAPAARLDPLRFVPRLQPGQDAARAARPAGSPCGRYARPHRPQLLPAADLRAVPQRARLRIRVRDRRLPGCRLRLVAARRQVRPRRGDLADGSADRNRAGRARRAGDDPASGASPRGGHRMSTQAPERSYRIGDVAERVGVTTRTIRYYEELGLLGTASARTKGAHRLYSEADIARLEELIRLRDLLGLTLEELVALAEAEEARAALRDQWAESATDTERARIVEAAIPLVERQLELVRARQDRLSDFAGELSEKLRRLKKRQTELGRKT